MMTPWVQISPRGDRWVWRTTLRSWWECWSLPPGLLGPPTLSSSSGWRLHTMVDSSCMRQCLVEWTYIQCALFAAALRPLWRLWVVKLCNWHNVLHLLWPNTVYDNVSFGKWGGNWRFYIIFYTLHSQLIKHNTTWKCIISEFNMKSKVLVVR